MSPTGDSAVGKRNRDFSVPTTYRSSEVTSPTSSRVAVLGVDNTFEPSSPTATTTAAPAAIRAETVDYDKSNDVKLLSPQEYYEIGKKLLGSSPVPPKPLVSKDSMPPSTVSSTDAVNASPKYTYGYTDDNRSVESPSHGTIATTLTSPPTSLVSPISPLPTTVTSPTSPHSLTSQSEKLNNDYKIYVTSPISEAETDAKSVTKDIPSSALPVVPLLPVTQAVPPEQNIEPTVNAYSDGENYEEDFEAIDTARSAVKVPIPPTTSTTAITNAAPSTSQTHSTELAAVDSNANSETSVRKIPSWHVSRNLSMYEEDEEEEEFDVKASYAKSTNSNDNSTSEFSTDAFTTDNNNNQAESSASAISKALEAEETALLQQAAAVDTLLKSQESATTIFAIIKYLFYYIQQHVQKEVEVCLTLTQSSDKNKLDFFNASRQSEFDGSIDYYDETEGTAAASGTSGRGDLAAKTKDIKSKLLNSYRSAESILIQYNNKKCKMSTSSSSSVDYHLIETSDAILQKLIDHFKKMSPAVAKSYTTPHKQSIKDEYIDTQLNECNLPDIAMAILRIAQAHSYFLLPAELLNGVLTLEKLKKEYKRMGGAHFARQEMFFMIIGHMFYVIDGLSMSASESIARLVC